MFERFTDEARRVVVRAQEGARELDHGYIGTEHLLLGLLAESRGIAARALQELGVTLQSARDRIEAIVGRGGEQPSGHIPFTPRAKKVLELSLREAIGLGDDFIGTEHILLGLLREGEGVANHVLTDLGAEGEQLRAKVLQISQATPREPGPQGAPLRAMASPGQFGQVMASLRAIEARLAALEARFATVERHLGVAQAPPAGREPPEEEAGPRQAS